MKVDISRIIANELKIVALQGKATAKCRISFPGLMMGLIKDTRMRIPTSVHEENKNLVDDTFIARHIEKIKKSDRGSNRASSSQAPQPHPEPQHGPLPIPNTAAVDFPSYVQWQHQCHTYTWDHNEALNRSNNALHQSIYNAQMHLGDANYSMMTPEEFHAIVNWPGVMPHLYGWGGAYAGTEERNEDEEEAQGDDDDDSDGDGAVDLDDPDRVHNANTTNSGSDDDFLITCRIEKE
jgi:hypothetical protein